LLDVPERRSLRTLRERDRLRRRQVALEAIEQSIDDQPLVFVQPTSRNFSQ
jgi:hypothetical protein